MKTVLFLIGLYAAWKAFFLLVFPRLIDRFVANKTRMTTEAGFVATADQSHLIGTVGVAATDLRPSGKMSFADQRIDVAAESGYITRGTPVEVVALRNGSPVVRPLDGENPSPKV